MQKKTGTKFIFVTGGVVTRSSSHRPDHGKSWLEISKPAPNLIILECIQGNAPCVSQLENEAVAHVLLGRLRPPLF